MSTKTYALLGKTPGWMHIAPIEPLTPKQWEVAENAIRITGEGFMRHVTADSLAAISRCSSSTAGRTLRKLQQMGLIRRMGHLPVRYYRKVWVR